VTTAISVHGLNFKYGGKTALSDVSFDVHSGSFCALLGPNGAGKSTLFSILTGLLTPPSGNVVLAGHNIAKTPRKALASIGVVFQQPSLDMDVSVEANMHYFAALQGMNKRVAIPRIQDSLERLDMFARKDEKVRSLNGGHRRRMEIARALIHDPKVLLLDEATVGLDANTRHAITDHVHALADDGMAILWATHLVDEIRDTDDLVLLHQSRVHAHGKSQKLRGQHSIDDWFQSETAPL
jgi:ABC-2 type transport system ATP-binding protein